MRRLLKVVTLNIWNRSGPYLERLPLIAAGLRALDPDLIGLQEVIQATDGGDGLDQLDILAKALAYHGVFGRTPTEHGYPFGNAILSRWPIAKSEIIALPTCGSDHQPPRSGGGEDQRRNLTFAAIDSPHGTVPFFTTHLNWRLHEGNVRVQQVKAIAASVKRLAPIDGFPPIVCGDFNSEPDSDEMRFLRGLATIDGESVYFADCFAVAGDGSKGTTFGKKNPYARETREPDRRIDYIYVRGPDARGRGEPIDARVCFDAPGEARGANGEEIWPTDHFGVYAAISID